MYVYTIVKCEYMGQKYQRIKMTKYGREVMLTATEDNAFRTTRFMVTECDSKKEADAAVLKWIKEYPDLLKVKGNQRIIENTLGK